MAGRVDELRKRLASQPESRLFAQLAEELRKEGQLDEAIRVCRDGLQRHPAYASAHMTLGRALFDKGDLAGARAEFESVVEAAPDNILAGRLLGECLEGLGDLAGARKRYETTLLLAPEDPQIVARLTAVASSGSGKAPAKEGAAKPAAPGDDSPATLPAKTLAPTASPQGPRPSGGAAAGRPQAPSPAAAAAPRKPAPGGEAAPRRPAGIEAGGAASRPAAGKAPGTIPVGQIDRKTADSVEGESSSRTLPFGTPAPRLPGRSPVVRHQPRPVTTEAVRRALDEVAARRKAEAAAQPAAAEPKPAPARAEPEGELATPTLAELYVKQGFPDKAADVYRAILERDAGNAPVRARLQELESQLASQSTQRRAIQKSIGRLERLLVAVERVRRA